jgi:addiction module HigA family antidote
MCDASGAKRSSCSPRVDPSKVNSAWRARIRQILSALHVAERPADLDIPGFDFHELKGDRKGTFAVKVTGNWRNVDEMTMEPSHPGEILRETIIPALGMTIKDVAVHLGVSRAALSDLVNEKRSVSLDMARRLGAAFGNGARFWLALQMQYDLWHAEHSERARMIAVKPLKAKKAA